MINIRLGIVAVVTLLFSTFQVLGQPKTKRLPDAVVSGIFKLDYRYYPEKGLYPGQHSEYASNLFQPEIYLDWKKGKRLIQFKGFARLDQYDNQRTHADIRELYWQGIFKKWELSVGVRQVYWGVTESNHVVDVINQLDVLEGFDVEQKLGQPMINASFSKKWGTLDFYVMTYFRQMKFPGPEGRGRPPFLLDGKNIKYESEFEEFNPDLAVRWAHSLGVFDFGVSHFYGTSRVPLFQFDADLNISTFYELINQTGIEVQASTGSMLWKGEIIHRISDRKTITGYTVGGEYTLGNFHGSGIDIGLLVEYNYDNRGVELITAMDNDMFYAIRIAANDKQSTSLLGGIIIDNDNKSLRYTVKAERRLGSSWKLSIESAGFKNIDDSEFLYLIRKDGYGQISLAKYF
jgi:hypothetical protein